MIKVGDRVVVNVDAGDYQLKDAHGTVFYIDHRNIFNDWVSPVQIELDEPWNKHGQTMLCVTLKEIKEENQ